MSKTISIFETIQEAGAFSGLPASTGAFKPGTSAAKKPLEVRKPVDVDDTQKVAFDADKTQKVKFNPQDYVTKEVPAFKAPGAKLSLKDLAPPKESNAKLLMKQGPSAVMKANDLPQPKKISPSAKITPAAPKQELPEPKSPLASLPKETLGGSHDFGGHKGFQSAFVSKTPEAEPTHKQAPPSLSNQNVRPRERKKIGEGSLINKFRGTVNKAIGRKDVPIQRTSPGSADKNNLETPAIWRRNADVAKVPEPAPTQPTPTPSPTPAQEPLKDAPVAKTNPPASQAPQGPGSDPIASQNTSVAKVETPPSQAEFTKPGEGVKLKRIRKTGAEEKPKAVGEPDTTPSVPSAPSAVPDKAPSQAKAKAKEKVKQGTAWTNVFHTPTADAAVRIGHDLYGKTKKFINYAARVKKV